MKKKHLSLLLIMILTTILFCKIEAVKAFEVKGTGEYSSYTFKQVEEGNNEVDVTNYYYSDISTSTTKKIIVKADNYNDLCIYKKSDGSTSGSNCSMFKTLHFENLSSTNIKTITLNDKPNDFYLSQENADNIYLSIAWFEQEYSKLVLKDNNDKVVNTIIIYISPLPSQKKSALEEIEKNLNSSTSDAKKKLIEDAKDKINNATTKEEIDKIVSQLKVDIEKQDILENDTSSKKSEAPTQTAENKNNDVKNPKTGAFAGFAILLLIIGCALTIYIKRKNMFKKI